MRDYIDYIKGVWKMHRNDDGYRSTIVVNRLVFPEVAEALCDCEDIVFISIESTDDCAKFYGYADNSHYLPSADSVLNVEFDDLENDVEQDGYVFRTITDEQSDAIVRFVEQNLGKHFVIHCRAGKSRSQGVSRYIMDMYPEVYRESAVNGFNRCVSPNMEVVRKLKRSFYRLNNIF